MDIQLFSTGTVQITRRWQQGNGSYPLRLLGALTDTRFTEPLPIWSHVIAHPEGLIVIDTGIPHDANAPVWFPPHMRLAQRAAPFQIAGESDEVGPQMRAAGLNPEDVRWVVLTHLHQDHEGGLRHFPNAEFLVSAAEWTAASGLKGRLGGYLNTRWPKDFAPTLVRFEQPDAIFDGRFTLTRAGDVHLVPTPGHSAGHLSVIVEDGDHSVFVAGDASYSQGLLLADALDGVSADAGRVHVTHGQIVRYAAQNPTVYLPSHEWASAERLVQREAVRVAESVFFGDNT